MLPLDLWFDTVGSVGTESPRTNAACRMLQSSVRLGAHFLSFSSAARVTEDDTTSPVLGLMILSWSHWPCVVSRVKYLHKVGYVTRTSVDDDLPHSLPTLLFNTPGLTLMIRISESAL